jgi:hypothetical protein
MISALLANGSTGAFKFEIKKACILQSLINKITPLFVWIDNAGVCFFNKQDKINRL